MLPPPSSDTPYGIRLVGQGGPRVAPARNRAERHPALNKVNIPWPTRRKPLRGLGRSREPEHPGPQLAAIPSERPERPLSRDEMH